MQTTQLTWPQKRILIISFLIVLVLLSVWLFIFIPAKANVNLMKAQLNDVQRQIHEIENRFSEAKSLAVGIQMLVLRNKVLENKFPNNIEESFKILSNVAEQNNIKIISIKPSGKKILLDESDKEFKVEGKSCEMVYVNLFIRTSYEDLIKYRQLLEEKLPGFVAIETLSIQHNAQERSNQLLVSMGFNLYLLK